MSKLQELIQKLCPNGVEYKKLGDFCEIKTGKGITKSDAVLGGTYPIISGGQSPMGYYHTFNREANTVTISRVGAYAGFVNYIKERFYLNDKCFSVIPASERVSTLFLFYALKNMESKIKELQSEGGVPTINTTKVSNLEIPLPPFEIQEEVALILDRFAEYAAELQAELQARKEQYEYYRNKLLTFTKIGGGTQSVTLVKMSEVGTFIRGKRFVRTDIVSDGVPCIHYGDMYTYYGLYATQSKGRLRNELASKMRYAQKNDVVIVAAGENKEDIGIGLAWIGDEPAAVHDACFIFRSDLYPQYVSHYLRSDYYHKQIVKYVSEGKICSISAKGLGNAIIPILPYEEQVRIATLLNKFDTLVGNLTEGLPAEIAAVQEQYEYYRNKLLSFPRIKISA
jgi:type I restriction enzyme S subunit